MPGFAATSILQILDVRGSGLKIQVSTRIHEVLVRNSLANEIPRSGEKACGVGYVELRWLDVWTLWDNGAHWGNIRVYIGVIWG